MVVAACSGTAPTDAPSVPAGSAAPTDPPAPTAAATTTAVATLPGGLEVRHGRPAFVDGEAAACVPLCGKGRVAGGKLPAGRYQTQWFFGGYMTFETDGTWELSEDSDGELSLPVSGSGDDTYRLAFFLDPVLVVDDKPQGVPSSAAAYVVWLSGRPQLVVGKPIETSIGTVPAAAIDIRLAPSAPHQYADCPAACVAFLQVAAFDHSDGILGDDVDRLMFADVSYSGSDHLLVVKVEGRDDADLRAVLARLEPLISTVIVPANPGHLGG
jgi:hypothetical protein